MKKLIFTLFVSLITITSFGQDMSIDDLYGDWKVSKIVSSSSDIQFQALSDGFKNATFSLQENGTFNLSSTFNTPMFKLFTEKSNNSKWIFNDDKQLIKIGHQNNQYSIMGIIVKQKQDKVLFQLNQTELIMEVEKQ